MRGERRAAVRDPRVPGRLFGTPTFIRLMRAVAAAIAFSLITLPSATAAGTPTYAAALASANAGTERVFSAEPGGHTDRSRASARRGKGEATRIRIPSMRIDLPVVPSDLKVPGNRDFYPLCDVAQFMRAFVNPGQAGATYIYGHARKRMFGPLLKASRRKNGASMIGAPVEVYTSDNRLHLYEIYRVKRHARDFSIAYPPPGEHILVLQTSEGVSGTVPKLQIAARPISVRSVGRAAANPKPKPRVCLPR